MRMGLSTTALSALLASATPALAQSTEAVRRYEIVAGPLDDALKAFAQQSEQQILYPAALVAGRRSPGISGSYDADAALAALLRGTGLSPRRTRPNVFVLYDPAARAGLEAEATLLDEVVVTGSYLRGADSPSPVTVLTSDELERRGRATVADALAALPQNFTGSAFEGSAGTGADRTGSNLVYATGLNLRGLGPDATLVLVNGRRLAGTGASGDFADISSIPSAAVERVDVLLDGASALYGSDAIGGVVNVILHDRFEGFQSRVRVGGTSDGGADEFLFAQTAGWNWSSGSLALSYEYYDRGELRADQRRLTENADLRPFGGSDWREIYASPGNVMIFDPGSGSYSVGYAIPPNQDGAALQPGDFKPGVVNLDNQNEGRWSLPHQKRHSVFLAGRQDLGRGISVDGEVRYSDRRFESLSFADIAFLTITDANPHFVSPDGSTSSDIAYSFAKDLGPGVDEGGTESLGGSLGVQGSLAGWNLSGYLSGGREDVSVYNGNRVHQSFLSEALGTSPEDPATAFNTATGGFFNPYGDPAANSTEMLAFIGSGYARARNVSTVVSANAKIDGTLWTLPGGPLRIAAGVDVRRETFAPETVNFFFGAAAPAPTSRRYEREVSAAFVEARLPIVSAANSRPGVRRLELSLAGRLERYDDIGSTANPKVGLLYAPFEDLLLRASYGESFRAPTLPELNGRYRVLPTTLSDGAGDVIVLMQYGGNPTLRPETATSTTVGLVWTPSALERLRIETNWFRTEFTDRIGAPASENSDRALFDPSLAPFVTWVDPGGDAGDRARVEALLADPANLLPDYYPVEAYGAIVDARNVNAAALVAEGVDVAARYALDLGASTLSLDGAVTYLGRYERQITPTSNYDSLVGQPHFPAQWRGRAGGVWSAGDLGLGLYAVYVDGSRDEVSGKRVASWLTFDALARYDLSSGFGPERDLSLSLNVQNIFDEEPPFYNATRGIGYDAANTNILGRQVSLQLTKRW